VSGPDLREIPGYGGVYLASRDGSVIVRIEASGDHRVIEGAKSDGRIRLRGPTGRQRVYRRQQLAALAWPEPHDELPSLPPLPAGISRRATEHLEAMVVASRIMSGLEWSRDGRHPVHPRAPMGEVPVPERLELVPEFALSRYLALAATAIENPADRSAVAHIARMPALHACEHACTVPMRRPARAAVAGAFHGAVERVLDLVLGDRS
jgi:hypothetical protein